MEAAKNALGGGRLGDHALQLSARLSLMPWPESLKPRVQEALLNNGRLGASG